MNNAMTPETLRRALRTLDLSNAKLSNELTQARADGRKTTPAAVSAWLTGRVPVPAAVSLLLKARLVDLANRRPPPLGGFRLVTVGGGKGGSGSSPIAAFLAAAAIQRGYRVRVGATDAARHGAEYWTRDMLWFSPLVSVDLTDLGRTRRALEHQTDLLFVDAGNSTMINARPVDELDLREIDLAVIPIDPAKPIDRDPALRAVTALKRVAFDRFLLQPMMSRMSVGLLVEQGLERAVLRQHLDRLSEHVIFRRHEVDRPGTQLFRDRMFQDNDLETEYATLLDEVLRRLGVDQERLELYDRDFQNCSVDALLGYLGDRCEGLRSKSSAAQSAGEHLGSVWR